MTRNPGIRLFFEARVDGKVIARKQHSRSFVQGFARLLLSTMQQAAAGSQTATDGTAATTVAIAGLQFDARNAADLATQGIIVGTGTTAVAPTDTKLVTPIATGASSGQLRYLIQQFGSLVLSSTDTSFQLIRSFQNNSGATITVNELGVYTFANSGPKTYCVARDVIAGGIAVLAGKTLTITYTLSFVI